jgi:L-aspartate oxidase
MTERYRFDGVLVLGAGLAGLTAALAVAPRRALVISPDNLNHACSSAWAQGGVAVAFAPDDSAALHAEDTIAAGAGLVDPAMARLLTEAGPEAVRRLAALGAPFDRDAEGDFVQGLEAAHSRSRIAKVKGDQAGRAIMETVAAAAIAADHIELWAGARARALLVDEAGRVRGALIGRDGKLIEVAASATVLATGGLGALYAVTTNPAEVRGEGLALAALAGATIADPEFVQFHPTAVDVGSDPAPLASEALRGEGAVLVDADGRPFMAAYDPRAELAPRDIVARAIHRQILEGGGAFLDCRQAVGAPCRASTRSANAPRSAFTAPTDWPPTPCSKRRCSARVSDWPPATSPTLAPRRDPRPRPPICRARRFSGCASRCRVTPASCATEPG